MSTARRVFIVSYAPRTAFASPPACLFPPSPPAWIFAARAKQDEEMGMKKETREDNKQAEEDEAGHRHKKRRHSEKGNLRFHHAATFCLDGGERKLIEVCAHRQFRTAAMHLASGGSTTSRNASTSTLVGLPHRRFGIRIGGEENKYPSSGIDSNAPLLDIAPREQDPNLKLGQAPIAIARHHDPARKSPPTHEREHAHAPHFPRLVPVPVSPRRPDKHHYEIRGIYSARELVPALICIPIVPCTSAALHAAPVETKLLLPSSACTAQPRGGKSSRSKERPYPRPARCAYNVLVPNFSSNPLPAHQNTLNPRPSTPKKAKEKDCKKETETHLSKKTMDPLLPLAPLAADVEQLDPGENTKVSVDPAAPRQSTALVSTAATALEAHPTHPSLVNAMQREVNTQGIACRHQPRPHAHSRSASARTSDIPTASELYTTPRDPIVSLAPASAPRQTEGKAKGAAHGPQYDHLPANQTYTAGSSTARRIRVRPLLDSPPTSTNRQRTPASVIGPSSTAPTPPTIDCPPHVVLSEGHTHKPATGDPSREDAALGSFARRCDASGRTPTTITTTAAPVSPLFPPLPSPYSQIKSKKTRPKSAEESLYRGTAGSRAEDVLLGGRCRLETITPTRARATQVGRKDGAYVRGAASGVHAVRGYTADGRRGRGKQERKKGRGRRGEARWRRTRRWEKGEREGECSAAATNANAHDRKPRPHELCHACVKTAIGGDAIARPLDATRRDSMLPGVLHAGGREG
ncbi:hypothetical protein B0H16DRAFT_1686275 [Mycena metata]|uniref:Uncharacterized protein n=1 Tax=Mycena metata TaxID=1033252 RepID=A0AAD7JNS2_9AGAR|nr:hypothetical protein B0H16DRAFT_1686275 [Mycena metata]